MAQTLTGATIASTYKTLLKAGTTSNGVVALSSGSTTERLVFGEDDAADVRTALYVSQDRVGVGESAPLGVFHVKTAAATDSAVDAAGDELILENSGNTGMTILSGTTGTGTIYFGDSGDTNIGYIQYNHNGNAINIATNTAIAMAILSSGNVGIGDTAPASPLEIEATDGSATVSVFRQDADIDDTEVLGRFDFQGSDVDAVATRKTGAFIQGKAAANWSASGTSHQPTEINFYTQDATDGDSLGTPRMTIDHDGNCLLGLAEEAGQASRFWLNVSYDGQIDQAAAFWDRTTDTSTRYVIWFKRDVGGTWADVGSIATTNSATAFNTSSDYRLKENQTLVPDALLTLNLLKPYEFNFKSDPSTRVQGFFAHEVDEIVPQAITGEKDEVDEDGKAMMQGIDQSKLVPLLVAAVQELSAKVEALENNNEQGDSSNEQEQESAGSGDSGGDASSESTGENSGGDEGNNSESSDSIESASGESESSSGSDESGADNGDESSGSSGSDASDDSEGGSGEDDGGGNEEPSEEWTKDQLKAYMDANGIEYNSGDTKSDLLLKITISGNGEES